MAADRQDHWFQVQPNGIAAAPANAKGWLAVIACFAVIIGLAIICFGVMAVSPISVLIFVLGSLVATGALVAVAMAKTKGEWRWRKTQSADE